MAIGADDRAKIAAAFQKTMPAIAQMVHTYTQEAGAPERFALVVFDGTDAGGDWGGDLAAREISDHEIRVSEWINDHAEIARKKVRVVLRTGRDTIDVVKAGEAFMDDEVPYPGGCIAEIDGKKIVVATSGLRGTEDEPFSLLILELLKRALVSA